MNRRGQRALSLIAALIGAALFAYAVRRAGVDEIVDAVRRVGWGLLVILALAGIRFLIRAQCWRRCLPPHTDFPFPRALAAFLAGDAVGNVIPLGLLASEPTKVVLTRFHLPTRESVASLFLENLIYAASVLAMVGFGLVVLVLNVPMPRIWDETVLLALVIMTAGSLIAWRAIRGTWDPDRGPRPRWRERLASARAEALRFSGGHPRRLWRVFGLDLLFHALAVVEVYVTLQWLLGDHSPTFVQAIVFEALNRVITAAFKFVPFRVGIDEVSAGALAPMLSVDPAAGVALAVVRKVRNLFWAAIGLAIASGRVAPGTDRL